MNLFWCFLLFIVFVSAMEFGPAGWLVRNTMALLSSVLLRIWTMSSTMASTMASSPKVGMDNRPSSKLNRELVGYVKISGRRQLRERILQHTEPASHQLPSFHLLHKHHTSRGTVFFPSCPVLTCILSLPLSPFQPRAKRREISSPRWHHLKAFALA